MRLLALLSLVACAPDAPVAPADEAALVFGTDGRQEASTRTEPAMVAAARATVGLVAASSLQPTSQGWSLPGLPSLAQANGVCPQERYADQPVAPFCSGVLVEPDRVLTSDTCIAAATCDATAFVFDFATTPTGVRTDFDESQVYGCDHIADQGDGWALVALDRASPRTPLRLGTTPPLGTPVAYTGHPGGLPLKAIEGATVRALSPTHASTNLDLYAGGGTGGPVVDLDGHLLGIADEGPADWVWDGSCFASVVCNDSGCPELQSVLLADAFAPAVHPCPDANNGPSEAEPLVGDRLAEVCAGDEDWYTLAAVAGEPVEIELRYNPAHGELTPQLWSAGQAVGSLQGPPGRRVLQVTPTVDTTLELQIGGDLGALEYLLSPMAVEGTLVVDAPASMNVGQIGTWVVRGAAPWHTVTVLYGQPGSTPIEGCGARPVGLEEPFVLGQATADALGEIRLEQVVPTRAAGRDGTFFAVTHPGCQVSPPTLVRFHGSR